MFLCPEDSNEECEQLARTGIEEDEDEQSSSVNDDNAVAMHPVTSRCSICKILRTVRLLA